MMAKKYSTKGGGAVEQPSVNASTIAKMHGLLRSDVRPVLAGPITIEPGDQNWKGLQSGLAEFHMLHLGSDILRLESDSGRRRPSPLEWWVSWGETWRATGAGKFLFKGAGWHVYCGHNAEERQLLLRAEWDAPSPPDLQNAGQPHWHVHRVLELPWSGRNDRIEMPLESLEALESLDELSGLTDPAVSPEFGAGAAGALSHSDLHRFHLGMAGWHYPGEYPACWQCPTGDVCETLRRWSIAALLYIRGQLTYVERIERPTSI
jgi:hypothetical protein